MKSIDLLEAIGEIDEKLLETANKKKKSKKAIIISFAAAVACVALIFTSYFPFEKDPKDDFAVSSGEVNSGGEAAVLASDDISIYYVENGEIKSETKHLECAPETIFNVWKSKNNISDEVKLISSKIESNGTTSSYEVAGQKVMAYTIGDYFVYNITVSKNLENYYGENKELLLEALKKTMTGYSYMSFDEVNLILE